MSPQPTEESLERTLRLLSRPPERPDVHDGYLDLVGSTAPKSSGRIQTFWLSQVGSRLYDGAIQVGFSLHEQISPLVGRKMLDFLDVPGRLQLTHGSVVLDVGSGPGNITRSVARAIGDGGLVVGLDVSPAMLTRAVRNTSVSNVVYTRADANNPPFQDGSVDAVCCSACLQLLPEPFRALDEMKRVLRPGGRIALSAPSSLTGVLGKVTDAVERAGEVRLFRSGELRRALEERGFEDIRDRSSATMQILDATKSSFQNG